MDAAFFIIILLFAVVWLVVRVLENSRALRRLETLYSALLRDIDLLRLQAREPEEELRAAPSQPAPHPPAPSPGGPDKRPIPTPERAPTPVRMPPVNLEPSLPVTPASPAASAETVSGRPPGETKPSGQPIRPPSPPPAAWKLPKFDWEGLVGVKLFSWIAGIAMTIGAILFLSYSIDRGWLQPPVRLTIGIIAGIGLLILCELKAARKYPVTANAMDAAAIAILFSSFYAASALWHLVAGVVSFALLVLVTVVAVLLSIRRDSLFIALLGLLGGFATPILLSTGENRPVSLFAYILLLNAGLAWVAARKKWPLLTTLTLAFTTFYQWGWVSKFLTAGQLPLAVGIFTVFPVLTFAALAFTRQQENKGWQSLYGKSAETGALLPILFAVYLSSVRSYGSHYAILFGFLFLLAAGFFAIALARGYELLHLAGGISALLVFAIWFANSYDTGSWPAILAFLALFVLLFLSAPRIARRVGRPFTSLGAKAVFAAPLLFSAFAALAAIEPGCAGPGLIFSVLFVLLAAASWMAITEQLGAIYLIAAFFALAAEAVWSSKYLTPERLLPGLALYAVFGLFYIGVPMVARRWRKPLQPERAGGVLVLASLTLLLFLAHGGGIAIWGLALLLLVLNLGLMLEGATTRFPYLSIAGIVLSWVVLAFFWAQANIGPILIPALLVIAGFAMMALAGMIWLRPRSMAADSNIVGNGLFLGLAGHLFLLVVAAQAPLAVPPWPLLGTMLVLNLAVGFAVLHTRRYELWIASLAASALILMVWVVTAWEAPWAGVAIIAAGFLAILSYVWLGIARRTGIPTEPFARIAAVTVLLAQVVAIFAARSPGSPGVGFLAGSHLAFLCALMVLAWSRRLHNAVAIAVLPSAIAVSFWILRFHGSEFLDSQLLFAGCIYFAFILYPLLLGRRAERSLAPYLAAVLASVPFFFQARYAMMEAGWGNIIGILPVTQAILMAWLLLRLLNMESAGKRTLGRLALVAGAALAFVTVAIPLQLEKEWITIGWALEGAALAWLFGKLPHRGLFYAANGLLGTVFVRLALNPSVLVYRPRSATPIWNWYLYTYLLSAAALLGSGWLLAKSKNEWLKKLPHIPLLHAAAGAILLFLLLNIEIADYFSTGEQIAFHFSATLAQDMTYTLGWALFAVALLAVGIILGTQPARIAALGLLVATILKCFIHDLGRLGGLYRVMSFVGLAICLALVALALQKFVLAARKETG
jgi:hypothetical protein